MTKMSCLTLLGLLAATAQADPLDQRVSLCRGPYALKLERMKLGQVFSTMGELATECSLRFEVAPEIASTPVSIDLAGVKMSTVLDVLAGAHGLDYALTQDGAVRVTGAPASAARPTLRLRPCPDSKDEGCAEIDGKRYRFSRTSRIPLPKGGLVTVRVRPEPQETP